MPRVGSVSLSEYQEAQPTYKGVIVAVKAIDIADNSDSIVNSAIDSADRNSAGMADSAIRSTTGYGGIMGVVGRVAGQVAGSTVHALAKNAKADAGVAVSVKLAVGSTTTVRQLGVPSDFPIGAKVVIQNADDGGGAQIAIAR